jgi:hypothetical protein
MVRVGQWVMADPGLFGQMLHVEAYRLLKKTASTRYRVFEVNVFDAGLHVTLGMNTPDIIITS